MSVGLRISSDGVLTIVGTHYDTEANIDIEQSIDDSDVINEITTVDEADECEALLSELFSISTTQETTNKIRLDFRGNLVAQVTEDAGVNSISISKNKVITVKQLITEEGI